jgi:hypothetical protein
MAQQKVELRKIRDFSENINDTFLFITQNFKPLVISFLTIAGMFLLATSIINGVYQSQFGNIFKDIIYGTRSPQMSPFVWFNGTYFLLPFFSWISVNAMHVVVIGYMKLYEQKQNEAPTTQEVWEVFKKYYLKVLVYTIPIFLLTIVGFFLCVLPGIYFMVVFLPFTSILMMEDQTFKGAYDRCFTIIRNNFWMSLAIYLVMYIIYSFSSGIISAGLAIVTGLLSYFTTRDISSTIGIATSVLHVFTYIFSIIFNVSVVLNYFTLTEMYDGTGMLKRLDQLGQGSNGFNNIQEEY